MHSAQQGAELKGEILLFLYIGNISEAPLCFTFSLPSFLFLGPPFQIHLEAKSLSWGQWRIVPVSLTCTHRSAIPFPFPIGTGPLEDWGIVSLTSRGWRSWERLPAYKTLQRAMKSEGSKKSQGMEENSGTGYGFSDLVKGQVEIRSGWRLRPWSCLLLLGLLLLWLLDVLGGFSVSVLALRFQKP